MTATEGKVRLTGMERDVLDMLVNGRTHWSDTGHEMAWGAALGTIVEDLHGRGLVTYPVVQATPAGRAALSPEREGGA